MRNTCPGWSQRRVSQAIWKVRPELIWIPGVVELEPGRPGADLGAVEPGAGVLLDLEIAAVTRTSEVAVGSSEA